MIGLLYTLNEKEIIYKYMQTKFKCFEDVNRMDLNML